jgi:eukaryotic-like serine/threonine-protein kinase
VFDLERGGAIRLTHDGTTRAEWSPDGSMVAYTSVEAPGIERIYVMAADGSGRPRAVTSRTTVLDHVEAWSPDGARLLFHRHGPNFETEMFTRSPHEEEGEIASLGTGSGGDTGGFSPDGRWVAYRSAESGRNEIYVTPYPGPGGKVPVSTDGGDEPIWARNGEIFYRSGNRMMAVPVETSPALRIGRPQLLFESAYVPTGPSGRANYDVAADGQRLLMISTDSTAGSSPRQQIRVVLNWFEELKQRVPVR